MKKQNIKKGFTMAEVLITVAVIVILCAIAIPGGVALAKNIKISSLDTTAREIFIAAQNRLTAIDIAGSFVGAGTAMTQPSDFKGTWVNGNDCYYYVANDSGDASVLNKLLPLGSIDDTVRSGGHYVIEYNSKTFTVYSVFYSESAFTYSEINETANFRTDKAVRRGVMVGYYGGSSIDREKLESCKKPEIYFEDNAEDATLKLIIKGYETDYNVSVLINGTDYSEKLNKESDYYELLIDSLDSGKQFKNLFTTITPGDDITASVTFSADGKLDTRATATANSLFASVSAETAVVTNARHLQNLDKTFSNVKDDIMTASQQADISLADVTPFESITNDSLTSFCGNCFEISSLSGSNGLFESAKDMTFKDVRIVNPKITSTPVHYVGALCGQLSGDNCLIENCRVYAYAESSGAYDFTSMNKYGITAEKAQYVGGLVGYASASSCKITNSFAALPYITCDEDVNAASAFIGYASNCEISTCYAACDSLSNATALMIGNAANASNKITLSYAVGNSLQAKQLSLAAATIIDSYYAVSYVNGSTALAATDYCFYNSEAVKTATTEAALSSSLTDSGWDRALTTVPYNSALAYNSYPYPTQQKVHYGSWPENYVKVEVNLVLASGGDGSAAGKVVIKLGTDTLYDSTTSVKNYFTVLAGEELSVKITPNDGYDLASAAYDTTTTYEKEFKVTVNKNTTIKVTFKQTVFRLYCNNPTFIGSGSGASYTATTPSLSLLINNTNLVETGTKITVTVDKGSLYLASVWYMDGSNTVYATKESENVYTFTMPAKDATLYVEFTSNYANYKITYYVQNPNTGDFEKEGEEETKFGIGEIINTDFLNALVAESHLTLTVSNGSETINAKYYSKGTVTKSDGGEIVFEATYNEKGELTNTPSSYTTTTPTDKEKTFDVAIYIARMEFKVTLKAGDNVTAVAFDNAASSTTPEIEKSFFYGQTVTADAKVAAGISFTSWVASPSRIPGSSDKTYTFEMPYFDITLTASAKPGKYLVTVNLFEDGQSWLSSSQSRIDANVQISLVSEDGKTVFPMTAIKSDDKSYIFQAQDVDGSAGTFYYILVKSKYIDDPNGIYYSPSGEQLKVYVESHAVSQDVHFFTVTYNANAAVYTGTLPSGGTYLYNQKITVSGNTGNLANEGYVFSGWKDVYAGSSNASVYGYGGEKEITITRKTDFFAEWEKDISVCRLIYDANAPTGCEVKGELPHDLKKYNKNEVVTLQLGSLTCEGYAFKGWSTTEGGTTVVNTVTFTDGKPITVYAVWEKITTYTVSFYANDTKLKEQTCAYGEKLKLPSYTDTNFVGWRFEDDVLQAGDSLTITGDTRLDAVLTTSKINITYKYSGGQKIVTVGSGVSQHLYCAAAGNVTAWKVDDGSNVFYPCDETGRSYSSVAFTTDVTLVAVTEKVYNFQKHKWYNTLCDAVDKAEKGNTLVVYGDTEETNGILINKDIYVVPYGDHTVKFKGYYAAASGWYNQGCIAVRSSSVFTLGYSNVYSGYFGNLTIDANQVNRVVSVSNGATFSMYDGIELTNGRALPSSSSAEEYTGPNGSGDDAKSKKMHEYFGGGVYVARCGGSTPSFIMYGGKISYCTAISGGGVYLFTGSTMQFGSMESARTSLYSATKLYYELKDGFYKNAENVTQDNYKNYYIAVGNPEICYCSSMRKIGGVNDGGGGLLMLDLKDGALLLYSGSIRNNSAVASGGGIVTDGGGDDVKLRIYEVEISHNSAGKDGGGLYQWQGTLYIYNSVIRQNYAGNDGGGIYLKVFSTETSNIEFYCGEIAYNEAGGNGGAVFASRDTAKNPNASKTQMFMYGGYFRNNTAKGSGGGIYLSENCIYTYNGGYIGNNTGNGAANDVYFEAKTCKINIESDLVITDNPIAGLPSSQINFAHNAAASGVRIVEYVDPATYKTQDIDLFKYTGTDGLVLAHVDKQLQLVNSAYASTDRQIILYANGGSFDGTDSENVTTSTGATVTLATPTRPGYKLLGWASYKDVYEIDGQYYANSGNIKYEDKQYKVSDEYTHILYAMWEPYMLYYNLNVPEGNTDKPTVVIGDGGIITLGAPTKTEFVFDGYHYSFQGWAKKSDAKEPDYTADQTLEPLTEDTNLYAIWEITPTT